MYRFRVDIICLVHFNHPKNLQFFFMKNWFLGFTILLALCRTKSNLRLKISKQILSLCELLTLFIIYFSAFDSFKNVVNMFDCSLKFNFPQFLQFKIFHQTITSKHINLSNSFSQTNVWIAFTWDEFTKMLFNYEWAKNTFSIVAELRKSNNVKVSSSKNKQLIRMNIWYFWS